MLRDTDEFKQRDEELKDARRKTITPGCELFVIVMRDHAYARVGPFPSHEAMIMWGHVERDRGDDPRWQSLELPRNSRVPALHDRFWHPDDDENWGKLP